jgi:hypothetical protein
MPPRRRRVRLPSPPRRLLRSLRLLLPPKSINNPPRYHMRLGI